MWTQLNQQAAYYGILTTGILILIYLIYLIYAIYVKKINLSTETILVLLLLFIIAIGIHSLQHQAQADTRVVVKN